MSDFKNERDLDNIKKVKWRDRIYNIGNVEYGEVILFKDDKYICSVPIKSLKRIKENKMPISKSQEKRVKTQKKKSDDAANVQKKLDNIVHAEKKYVLLEDIVIKAGTVFYNVGERAFFGDYYEMHMAFGPDHVGNFLVEREMLEKPIGDRTEEIEFSFTELLE
jgi:hypothetical protein